MVGFGGTTEVIFKAEPSRKKNSGQVWWSSAVVIHYNFSSPGQTITAEPYCEQTDQMYRKYCQLQPTLIKRKGPILLHDNARPHVSQITIHKLNELGVEVLPHPPYSLDLSPTDCHLFRHFQNFHAEKYFIN